MDWDTFNKCKREDLLSNDLSLTIFNVLAGIRGLGAVLFQGVLGDVFGTINDLYTTLNILIHHIQVFSRFEG
jgi:hypothetical protein